MLCVSWCHSSEQQQRHAGELLNEELQIALQELQREVVLRREMEKKLSIDENKWQMRCAEVQCPCYLNQVIDVTVGADHTDV